MLGGRQMPARQNTDVEAKAPQALPRDDRLFSFDLVLFATNDMERNHIPKGMEQALQVQPFRIALMMIDEICRIMQDKHAIAPADGSMEFVGFLSCYDKIL